jgi:glycosyltransferase involved in cell wall biosynthesis
MKVWIIEISDFLPEIDGGNRLYRAGMLANALVDNGHYVKWWTSTFNHQRRRQRFNVSTTINLKTGYCFRLLYGPGYKSSVSLNRVRHNRAVAREYAREAELSGLDEMPDIIYTCLPTLEVSEQVVNFGLRHNIPVVVDIRELWPENYLTAFPLVFRPILRKILKPEFSRAYKILHYATAITASSPAYLEWGIKTGNRQNKANDTWFPLGGMTNEDAKRFQDKTKSICLPDGTVLPDNSILISFIGTFTSHVDYKTLITVAREFHHAVQEKVHFLFVGDGDKLTLIRKLSKGIENVHLPGWCEKPVIDQLLSVSFIGLAPYLMELKPTLPNKPFEYMSAGLPILSSLEGELENILRRESIGLQYRGGNSNDLKQKIDWFLSHPDETKAMGLRAKALFENKYRTDLVYTEFAQYLSMISKSSGDKNYVA